MADRPARVPVDELDWNPVEEERASAEPFQDTQRPAELPADQPQDEQKGKRRHHDADTNREIRRRTGPEGRGAIDGRQRGCLKAQEHHQDARETDFSVPATLLPYRAGAAEDSPDS